MSTLGRDDGRRSAGRRVLGFVAFLPVILFCVWGALALHFAGPRPAGLATALAVAFGLGVPASLLFLRPLRVAGSLALAVSALLLLWWTSLEPRNDKDWAADVARIPQGRVEGDRLLLRNVRNFDYRSETDFTPRWEDREYDLSRMRGLDLYLSYWAGEAIAHTILSWDFDGSAPLAVSIETRKDKTQQYSALKGFFKQFELAYVAADERDLVRLRTNFRGERVYLYRLKIPLERARLVLLDYVARMNELVEQPVFYDAATQNCTTTIRMHYQHVTPDAPPFDWRVMLNGFADELLYERGRVDTSLPFAQLRARSRVDAAGRAAGDAPDFSRRIRAGLPGMGS